MTNEEKKNLIYFSLCILFCSFLACSATKTLLNPARTTSPIKGLIPQALICTEDLGSLPLNRPQGLTTDNEGNIYIADTGNNRLVKTDSLGNFIKETGGFGWGEGQFNQPTDLTLDYGLNLYVVDSQNKRVTRLDKNLNFISGFLLKANFLARGGWTNEPATVMRDAFESHPDAREMWRGLGTLL